MKKKIGFSWQYRVLYLTLNKLEIRTYFKWHFWGRRYRFIDISFPQKHKSFLLTCWPFEICWSDTGFSDPRNELSCASC